MRRYTFCANGTRYALTLRDTRRRDAYGKAELQYTFRRIGERVPIFSGDDFYAPIGEVPEGVEAAESLMSFLTLGLGDTDDEYFECYTAAQREFARREAEGLQCCVWDRWARHPSYMLALYCHRNRNRIVEGVRNESTT